MNRLSWDSTAPRRPGGKRSPQPRPEEMGLVEAEAELIRIAWAKPQRPPTRPCSLQRCFPSSRRMARKTEEGGTSAALLRRERGRG